MAEAADPTVAQRVLLAVGELESLCVLPSVAVQYLTKILHAQVSAAGMAEIIEADPALTARILAVASELGVAGGGERYSVRHVLDRLPAESVRDTLLGVRVLAAFEIAHGGEVPALGAAEGLILHSIGVACCARAVAELLCPRVDPHLAYTAGLLHDIGKLALLEVMPKSFVQITDEAQADQSDCHAIERRRLGIDHTIIGKNLVQKWGLAERLSLPVWLHHSHRAVVCETIPDARVIEVVRVANLIARLAGVGSSGSFGSLAELGPAAGALGISQADLHQLRGQLPDIARRKSDVLQMDMPNATARYCELVQTAAAKFAADQSQLSAQSRDLTAALNHLQWVRELLLRVGPYSRAVDVAQDFAVAWQRYFQTGSACLYLVASEQAKAVELAVVSALGQSHKAVLDVPPGATLVPRPAKTGTGRFAVVDAHDQIDWLFEQLEVEFDPSRTKLIPLHCRGRIAGLLAFELHYPGDVELFAERFQSAAALVGTVLGLLQARDGQAQIAERLASPAPAGARPNHKEAPQAAQDVLEILAEMAAGVAHELNNPLSVILGRAQLLFNAEQDQQKRQSLARIQEAARQASGIVDELMSFAGPAEPRATEYAVASLVEEAVELGKQKIGADHLNVQCRIADGVGTIFADSAQIASALASIICNAVESYAGAMGPVKVVADKRTPEAITIVVSDLGCGMDAETLRKAVHPFFSAKPAGRKRGMGLAFADRLIRLNGGSLDLTSEAGRGTTVVVTLPAGRGPL